MFALPAAKQGILTTRHAQVELCGTVPAVPRACPALAEGATRPRQGRTRAEVMRSRYELRYRRKGI